jgi:hypothetical protein
MICKRVEAEMKGPWKISQRFILMNMNVNIAKFPFQLGHREKEVVTKQSNELSQTGRWILIINRRFQLWCHPVLQS